MHDKKKNIIKQSVRAILRPLVRLMLKHGLTYTEFYKISKRVFFDEGRAVIRDEAKTETASHLSILTGLHRKEVTSFLKEAAPPAEEVPSTTNVSAAIIGKWLSDPAFITADDQPKPLPYSSEIPDEPSFCNLVSDISKDMRPRAYMDELLRLGLLHTSEDGMLHLLTQAFIPSSDFEQKFKFFTRNLGDHAAAGTQNMLSDTPRFIDRSAYHSGLSVDDVLQLRALVEKDGMGLLKKSYRKAEELSAKSGDKKNQRVIVGLYMFHEEKKDEKPQ